MGELNGDIAQYAEAVLKFPSSIRQRPNEAVVWQWAKPNVLPDSGMLPSQALVGDWV